MRIAIPELGTPQPNYPRVLRHIGVIPIQVGIDADPADFDGLLLPGGADFNPARYGAENEGSVGIDEPLDELQFTVLDNFVKAGKPVLGICRGHQAVAVYFGDKLIQDLPTGAHHKRMVPDVETIHLVNTVPGTILDRIYGNELVVNSSHHQAARTAPEGMEIMATSDDGVIEGLYHTSLPVFSVQWHPERMSYDHYKACWSDGSRVIRAFLAICRDGKLTDEAVAKIRSSDRDY